VNVVGHFYPIETYEELGEQIGPITILGSCQTIPAITGTLVTPVIGFVHNDIVADSADHFATLFRQSEEVEKVFYRSLATLTSDGYRKFEHIERNGKIFTLPSFSSNLPSEQRERIWGLTAIILEGVLRNAILPTSQS
jgi:hypothetical protein